MDKVRMYHNSRMTVCVSPSVGACNKREERSVSEVVPVKYSKTEPWKLIHYSSVKVKMITRHALEENLRRLNTKETFTVLETPNYFIIQYGNKCPVLIDRNTGRLAVVHGLGYSQQEEEHQAAIILELLEKLGYVDKLTYKQFRPKHLYPDQLEERMVYRHE